MIELSPENWRAEFGEDGVVNTPIGDVKMGDNQYLKLAQRGSDGKLGMIKPTLTRPDVIIEEESSRKDGQIAERNSSFVFVKAFTNAEGTRDYMFTSVTILRDGKEVVISNQEKETPRIKRLLKEGTLAYINKATLPSESTTSAQGDQSTIPGGASYSENKDTTNISENQTIEEKSVSLMISLPQDVNAQIESQISWKPKPKREINYNNFYNETGATFVEVVADKDKAKYWIYSQVKEQPPHQIQYQVNRQ